MKRVAQELIRVAKSLLAGSMPLYINLIRKVDSVAEMLKAEPRTWTYKDPTTDSREFLVMCENKHDFYIHSNENYAYEVKYSGEIVYLHNTEKENNERLAKYLTPEEIDKIQSYNRWDAVCWYVLQEKDTAGIDVNGTFVYIKPGNISDLVYLENKEDYNSGTVDKTNKSISSDALTWLKKFMGSAGIGNPSRPIEKELEQFKSSGMVKVYRGMGWYQEELADLKKFSSYPFQLGGEVSNTYSRPSSWSVNPKVAEGFTGTGPFWIVVEAEVNPSQVLVDTRTLDDAILDQLYVARQFEVILNKGTHRCRIVKIGIEKKSDLQIGWEGYSPDTWVAVTEKFDDLAGKLNRMIPEWKSETWHIGTPRQHYNGQPGIVLGRSKFNENDSLVWCVYYSTKNNGFQLDLDVWKKGSCRRTKSLSFKTLEELLSGMTTDKLTEVY